ncbi:MAG: CobW family GTP-binding protein [Eubacteriales bacterium]|nr:CobW family GTP-binding protein [Eubacteriales bacterium]
MTKIDVISGFLGSGKTTFIKKLLGEALKGEKIVLIENEFGEIGIDGRFLKDSGVEIREMSQGCICCSLVGDFEKSLKEVITKFAPERIIIEPSGVGKLSDIMKAVTDASASLDVVLNSAVTIVDAKKCPVYAKNFGEFFNNQIQYAGTVVLSRTDIATAEQVKAAVEIVKELNPTAEIVTTPLSELSGEKLLAVIEKRDDTLDSLRKEALLVPDGEDEEEHEHNHHHHHHHDDDDDNDDDDEHHEHHEHHHHHHHHGHDADEVFDSIGLSGITEISKKDLEKALKKLSEDSELGKILRAKGMIKSADEDKWYYFDLTPGEYEIREGAPDVTGKACVIGSELLEGAIRELFL